MNIQIYHYPRRRDYRRAALIVTIYAASALIMLGVGGILYTIFSLNNIMTTTQEPITPEQVSEYMRQQLAKAHELNEYAHIQVELYASKSRPDQPVKFHVYLTQFRDAREFSSFEECFAKLANFKPKTIAQLKREQAASLLAEAEALESQTN